MNASVSATAARADGLPTPRRHWALAGLWLAMAMTVIDSSVANIALPTLTRDLMTSAASTTWVVTAYQIGIVMVLLPIAALGERLGYVRVYQAGLVLFVLMSFACAMARSLELLAAFRFIQGLGAGAVMSVNGALMRFTWPKKLLARGLSYNAVVVACTAAGGPALAGLILSVAHWPWLFLINVPLGFIAFALIRMFAPRTDPETDSFDSTSAVLSATMFGALFLAVSDIVHGHWSPWLAFTTPVGAAAGIALFRRIKGRARPLIPLDLWAMPRLRLAYAASICGFAAQMCLLVILPFLLEARGLAVGTVALLVLPLPFGLAAISPIAGRLADKPWAGRMSAVGLGLFAAMLALLTLAHSLLLPVIALAMCLCGAGYALFQSPNNNVMIRSAPMDRAGSAAGMLAMCRLIGQTGGALIAAFSLRLAGGETAALWIAAALAVCSALFASRR